jgi:hypothetical protein
MAAGSDAIERLVAALPANAVTSVDRPAHDDGFWFLDVKVGGHKDVAMWNPTHGYGLWSSVDTVMFEAPDIWETEPAAAASRLMGLFAARPPATALLAP